MNRSIAEADQGFAPRRSFEQLRVAQGLIRARRRHDRRGPAKRPQSSRRRRNAASLAPNERRARSSKQAPVETGRTRRRPNSEARRRLAIVVGRVPASERGSSSGPRQGRVQQVALGREQVLVLGPAGDPRTSARRRRSSSPNKRPGAAATRGKHTLLQAAHEQRAPRRRARRRERGRARRPPPPAALSPLSSVKLPEQLGEAPRAAQPGRSSGARRARLAQLGKTAAARHRHRASLVELLAVEHYRL